MKEDMDLDLFKNFEKPIYPKAGEDLLDFLLKQRGATANVTICPSCSAVFDKNAAKAYHNHEEVEIEKQRKEVKKKLAEKEVKTARLRKDVTTKQQIVIVTKKIGLSVMGMN